MKNKILKLKFIFLAIILIQLSFLCGSCQWQLRNPNEIPPQLKILYLSADTVESHFFVKLKNLLDSMRIQQVANPKLAPYTLLVSHYALTRNNPSVSTTYVAITYVYSLQVTVSIIDANGYIVAPPRQIVANRAITVNVNQIFTINSATLFQQELEREVINLVYYWLTSESTWRSLTPPPQEKNTHAEVPAEGNSPFAMGDHKGENRDSPSSFRAIGFADAQDINNKAMGAVLSGNG